MAILRHSFICALLFSPVVLAGCGSFSDVGYTPRRGAEGGFSVLVDGADHPAATQVTADIGTFAQSRGFGREASLPPPFTDPLTREPIPRAPDRYVSGTLELEVSYQPTTHRVSAYLHDSANARARKVIRRFYEDYHRNFAPQYGQRDPISESAFSCDQRNGASDDEGSFATRADNPGRQSGGSR